MANAEPDTAVSEDASVETPENKADETPAEQTEETVEEAAESPVVSEDAVEADESSDSTSEEE